MRPSRAPSRHKTDKRGSQKSVRQSDCSSTSRLAKDPHVQLASTIDQSLCAVAYLVSKYPQGASTLAPVHVSETRHVTRMRERRQATGFIGGPETEIKNVPENQSCPQDVPLPQRIV